LVYWTACLVICRLSTLLLVLQSNCCQTRVPSTLLGLPRALSGPSILLQGGSLLDTSTPMEVSPSPPVRAKRLTCTRGRPYPIRYWWCLPSPHLCDCRRRSLPRILGRGRQRDCMVFSSQYSPKLTTSTSPPACFKSVNHAVVTLPSRILNLDPFDFSPWLFYFRQSVRNYLFSSLVLVGCLFVVRRDSMHPLKYNLLSVTTVVSISCWGWQQVTGLNGS